MASVRTIALAGGIAIAATTFASAADLRGPIHHEPLPVYHEAEAEFAGGWYLRGDIGITNQTVSKLTNAFYDAPGQWPAEFLNKGFTSSPFIGAGVGYAFNSWFRVDVTGEYRSKAAFSALDRYGPNLAVFNAANGTNYYTALKHEWVGLVNAYIDLGTWHGITPFVGAGLGAANVTISNFTDTNTIQNSVEYAPRGNRTNFAWALYAGAAVDVTDNLKLELAYRYLNMGDGKTGAPIVRPTTNATIADPWVFRRLESHDVKVGVRWMFAAPTRIAHHWPEEPIVRKY
jgi:opacity protein-like surface antigen